MLLERQPRLASFAGLAYARRRPMRCVGLATVAVALWSGLAAADGAPRVVLHPLTASPGLSPSDDVSAMLSLEAALQQIELVGSIEAGEVLAGRRCNSTDTECLSALARATRVRFALRVELTRANDLWGFRAKVVREDGALIRRAEVRRAADERQPVRGVRPALNELLGALALATLNTATPLADLVAETPPPPVETPPTAPSKPPTRIPGSAIDVPPESTGTGGARVAGLAIGAVGLGALAVGGILGLVANAEAQQLTVSNEAIPRSQLETRRASDSKATAATLLAVGGGVAAAVGVLMVILGGPAEAPELAVVPVPGGAAVSLGVRLP